LKREIMAYNSSADPNHHEWKITDEETIAAIRRKETVHGPRFRMCGFSWRLKFDPEFKANVATLSLVLVSLPPKIQAIDVRRVMFLKEQNVKISTDTPFGKGSEKGLSWGWSASTLSTADALKLDTFTFGVEITLNAVYNTDDEDVTDSYLLRSTKSPKMIKSANIAPSSLNMLTAKIDALSQRMDSLATAVEVIQNRLNEDEKENGNAVQQQIDAINAKLQTLGGNSSVVEDNSAEAIFKKWVEDTLKLPEYYELFMENGVETLNDIKLLTESELKMIGITKIGHRKRMEKAIEALQGQSKAPASAYQQPVEGGTLYH